MSDRLPRSTPQEMNVSSSAIQSFLNQVETKGLELHSFMLLCNGTAAAEGWWAPYGPERPHMLFSLSKSFTSTAVGVAESEGLLHLDDRVISFFPELVPDNPSEHLCEMQIRHLLSMSTGHAQESLDGADRSLHEQWVKAILQLPVEYEPGTRFVYNSGASYLLSAIIQEVTGVTLLEYLQPRLFKPLGIENPTWDTSPQGINTGGWGLSLTTEDIAKFGQLYLQKGIWNGRRLLSEDWVDRATSAHISNGDDPASDWAQGYGYQFWRCRHNAYRGDGMFGQNCIVLPEHNAVIAITAAVNDLQAVLEAVWDHLLPGFGTVDDLEDQLSLTNRLQSLSLRLPRHQSGSPLEASIGGKRYVFEPNEEQIKAVAFAFQSNEAVITLWEKDEEHTSKCGRGSWLFSDTGRINGQTQQVAASCTWRDDQTLVVTQCFVETPFVQTAELRFEDDELRANITLNVGQSQQQSFVGKVQKPALTRSGSTEQERGS
jgi:CubicO group peptidase (beta-lactamase class C family)